MERTAVAVYSFVGPASRPPLRPLNGLSLYRRSNVTRDAFKQVVAEALETVTVAAERRLARILPRKYMLGWLGGPVIVPGEDVVELLTQEVFVSEAEIFPCVDLLLDELRPDGLLLIVCHRAGYPPSPYGEHWQYRAGGHDSGRVGPFKLGCNSLVQKLSAGRLAV